MWYNENGGGWPASQRENVTSKGRNDERDRGRRETEGGERERERERDEIRFFVVRKVAKLDLRMGKSSPLHLAPSDSSKYGRGRRGGLVGVGSPLSPLSSTTTQPNFQQNWFRTPEMEG